MVQKCCAFNLPLLLLNRPDVIWIHPEFCHIVCDLLLHLCDVLFRRYVVSVRNQRQLPIVKLKLRFSLSKDKVRLGYLKESGNVDDNAEEGDW